MRFSFSRLIRSFLVVLAGVAYSHAACSLVGAGSDPATKAYLAPVVFHGRLTGLTRRGLAVLATFMVHKVYKGGSTLAKNSEAVVEMAVKKNSRCRGVLFREGALRVEERYVVFAAWRRPHKMMAVADPEAYSRRRAVAKVLCPNCAKPPSIRSLNNARVELHSKLKLKCKLSGNPPPRVIWFKNDIRIQSDGRIKVRSKRRYSHLVINRVSTSDSGQYRCQAQSILGNASATSNVIVTVISSTDPTLWPFKKAPCPKRSFCLNGGECSYYETVGEYVCECAEGYRGQRCESKAISTLSSPSPVDIPKAPHDLDATTRMLQHYWG